MHARTVIESVDDDVAAILRQKTPAERLAIAFGMWRSARKMLTSMLRGQHPDWSNHEVDAEVARRMSHGAR
jgi:hypothetical protein